MKNLILLSLLSLLFWSCKNQPDNNILFIAGEEDEFTVIEVYDTLNCPLPWNNSYHEKDFDLNFDGQSDLRLKMRIDTNVAFHSFQGNAPPYPFSSYDPFYTEIRVNFVDSFRLATPLNMVKQNEYFGDTVVDFYGAFPRITHQIIRSNTFESNPTYAFACFTSNSFQYGDAVPNNLNYIPPSGAEIYLHKGAINKARYQYTGSGIYDSLIGNWECYEKLNGSIEKGIITYLPFRHTVEGSVKVGWISLILTSDNELVVLKYAFQ